MTSELKRRSRNADKPDLLSLQVDPKIAQAFRDQAYKLKLHQYALFEEMWRLYAEKKNVAS